MIDLLYQGLDFMRHLDEHLQRLVTDYQTFAYVILGHRLTDFTEPDNAKGFPFQLET